MASREQIEETYNYMDEVWRLSFGPHPDLTCAYFNGDFSKTLERAQADKHTFILDSLGVGPDSRVLDVGCGWGPLLDAIRRRGATGVGITLSTKQMQACRRGGLDAHLLDWRDLSIDTFGGFDAVAAVGPMEHFCSPEEYWAGKQDSIYQDFFKLCHSLLPAHGRMYVQSMVWGRNAPRFEDVSLDAPKGSNEYITAIIGRFYPGSFGAFGKEHFIRCAAPLFRVITTSDGRLDYIETMRQWGRMYDFSPRKLLAMGKLVWPWLTDGEFRRKIESIRGSYNNECFKREILTLCRIVFEKA
jgi:cyclopropane-fatty-acyl-phospholipid synthase